MELGIDGLSNAKEIGSGASATVYRASQLNLNREVAVKVLRANEETFVRRFEREAKTVGNLSQHPGIVTVFGTGVNGTGHPYLILELCESSLLDQLASGPLEPLEACGAMSEVAAAVANAHQAGVVHRDLKPANVLISSDGRYVVTDFGISTVSEATLGQTDSTAFTAGYVAPETLSGEDGGPASDVYALGATLFHTLMGAAPFIDPDNASNLLALAQRVATEPVPDLRSAGIDNDVCRILEAAMAKNPAERPSAASLATYFVDVVAGRSPAIEAAGIGEPNSELDTDQAASLAAASYGPGLASNTLRISAAPARPDAEVDTAFVAMGLSASPIEASGEFEGRRDPFLARLDREIDGPAQPLNDPPSHFASAPPEVVDDDSEYFAAAPPEVVDDDPEYFAVAPPVAEDNVDYDYDYQRDAAPNVERRELPLVLVGVAIAVAVLVGLAGYLIVGRSDTTDSAAGQAESGLETLAGPEGESAEAAEPSEGQAKVAGSFSASPDSVTGTDTVTTGTTRIGVDGLPINESVDTTVNSAKISVPNVVGRNADTAAAALAGDGFTVNRVEEANSGVGPGNVIRQDPGVRQATPGSVVTIFVSADQAKASVAVPYLVGLTEADATSKLAKLGLNRSIVNESNASVSAGKVVRTSPGASTTVTVGGTVILTVSAGSTVSPTTVKCSDVIGLRETAANDRLRPAGISVTSNTEPNNTAPSGEVTGCKITGARAHLLVSSGKPTTTTAPRPQPSPDPTPEPTPIDPCSGIPGMNENSAKSKLMELGFTANSQSVTDSSKPDGEVISCSTSGSTATLRVSAPPAIPTTCSDVTNATAAFATTKLEGLGLTVTQAPRISTTIAEGRVISCSVTGTTADMLVSSGSGVVRKAVIPDVSSSTEAEARATLESSGFKVLIDRRELSTPAGSVNGTRPWAGSTVDFRSTVTIVVSTGPAQTKVPFVMYKSRTDAIKVLSDAGFEYSVSTEELAKGVYGLGKTIKQFPASGTMVDSGSTVAIIVGVPKPVDPRADRGK